MQVVGAEKFTDLLFGVNIPFRSVKVGNEYLALTNPDTNRARPLTGFLNKSESAYAKKFGMPGNPDMSFKHEQIASAIANNRRGILVALDKNRAIRGVIFSQRLYTNSVADLDRRWDEFTDRFRFGKIDKYGNTWACSWVIADPGYA